MEQCSVTLHCGEVQQELLLSIRPGATSQGSVRTLEQERNNVVASAGGREDVQRREEDSDDTDVGFIRKRSSSPEILMQMMGSPTYPAPGFA